MKIAVTSKGNDVKSAVDQHFGRAVGFIIADTESEETEFIDNEQNLNAVQGAGIQAAENISRHGVETVITGHCGPKAFRTLSAAGIKVILGAKGTVAETIKDLKEGKLFPTDSSDMESHWV